MERNAEKRRPKTNSPSKRNDLVSGAKARFDASVRRTREFFVSLRSAVPPLRDIVILVALTVIAFASGFFVGRGTTQPALPGDFVSIQEIDIHGTSSHLADVTGTEDVIPQDIATYQTADGEPTGGNEDGVTLKGKEATASTVPEKDTGVVGPVPAETPEVKSEVRPRESAVPTKEKMIMPAQGRVVSDFGWRKHPVYQDWRYHTGVDIGVPEGAPVSAALSGKVVQLDSARELGLYVVIEHLNGIKTKYAHLTSSSVNPGDSVKQGQIIGNAGASGVTSGPYLHFEVVSRDEAVDPVGFQ
jgi:murein DD-endopeptidase MepM/ murein hydrolase activator NlpD